MRVGCSVRVARVVRGLMGWVRPGSLETILSSISIARTANRNLARSQTDRGPHSFPDESTGLSLGMTRV
jgi:hypothetical protein